MSGYDINFSITALCPSCGEALPSHSYLTEIVKAERQFERANTYALKDRRVFISPCQKCFKPVQEVQGLVEAVENLMTHRVGDLPNLGYIRDNDKSRAAIGQLAEALSKFRGGDE